MRHGLRSFILNRDPTSLHGFARGRISTLQFPGVLQQESRFDYAPSFLERRQSIVAALRIEHGTGNGRNAVVRFEQSPGPVFAKGVQPPFDEPSGMGVENSQLFRKRNIFWQK